MNNVASAKRQLSLPVLSLFTSAGTLLCCALPALLVSIGAGAVLAGLVSTAPWLVALSQYKAWTFGLSALMLVVSGASIYNARKLPCPLDKKLAKQCKRLRVFTLWVYGVSVAIWCVGFFFAFLAVRFI
jgi:hypothetical protein